MSRQRAWSDPADISRRVRRSWDDGPLLGAYARGEPWQPWSVPLRGPRPSELAERLDEVRAWADRLERGSRRGRRPAYRLQYRRVGGRVVGSNQVPDRAWLDGYDQAWALLGVEREVQRYSALLARTQGEEPRLVPWAVEHPLQVLRVADAWSDLLAVVAWMERHAGRGVYLRQIDVSGVDTKFLESHKGVLAQLLDHVLPPEHVDGDARRSDLERRYGFLAKPEYVRFRFLGSGGPGGLSEITARISEMPDLDAAVSRVFVVENEISYLAFPDLDKAIVVYGRGYDVARLSRVPWLRDAPLHYWGDIDTHGFAILNRLRHAFPDVRSLLMDRATLLAHEAQRVNEPSPTNAGLDRLTAEESALYRDLVEGTLGARVRLEQERVNYAFVRAAVDATRDDETRAPPPGLGIANPHAKGLSGRSCSSPSTYRSTRSS